MILHEVDHIYGTIFVFGSGGEEDSVIFVDCAVVVFEIWFVAHAFPPFFGRVSSVVSAPPTPRVEEVSVWIHYRYAFETNRASANVGRADATRNGRACWHFADNAVGI